MKRYTDKKSPLSKKLARQDTLCKWQIIALHSKYLWEKQMEEDHEETHSTEDVNDIAIKKNLVSSAAKTSFMDTPDW